MYARLLGFLMLTLGCTGAGLAVASVYSSRVSELAALRTALGILETEICFSLRPLADALEKASMRARGPAVVLFRTASGLLAAGRPASDAWEAGVLAAVRESALTREDADVLLSLGVGLGVSPAPDQKKRLEDAVERLRLQESEARDRRSREGRLWGFTGVFGGLALAALLM